MPEIKLRISNLNDSIYKGIVLRKFFNMIFISEDGRKLTIYTATVFGGIKKQIDDKQALLKSSYDMQNDCSLKFAYEGEIITSVEFKDLTKSLWEQADCIKMVWGDCEKKTTQTEVEKLLNKIYGGDINIKKLNMRAEWPIFYINEQGKKEHEFIATHGIYERNENKKEHTYTLRSSHGEHNDGIEYMNWVKVNITLSESILKKNTRFDISFEGIDNTKYYTPDFTWYFAPEGGYRVDRDSAVVRIGNVSLRNLVQSVSDETTVRFKEWERDELIDERKKVRVNFSQYTVGNCTSLSEKGNVSVCISIINPEQSANKQFFMGLLVAFLLAFSADKTRMNDFYCCLQNYCTCPKSTCGCQSILNIISILFPIAVIMSYVSIIFKLKKCVPTSRKKRYYIFYIVKFAGVSLTIIMIIYAFGLWMIMPEFMATVVRNCHVNKLILICALASSIVFNATYIVYCAFIRKKKIYDYL